MIEATLELLAEGKSAERSTRYLMEERGASVDEAREAVADAVQLHRKAIERRGTRIGLTGFGLLGGGLVLFFLTGSLRAMAVTAIGFMFALAGSLMAWTGKDLGGRNW